jgi:hypothetical protein
MNSIPHVRVVVGFCLLAAVAYLGFSIFIVGWSGDAALRGDVIGTWKSFAVAAFAFWVGSSSGGKAKDAPPPPKDAREAADAVAGAATDRANSITGDATGA